MSTVKIEILKGKTNEHKKAISRKLG